RRRHTRSLRDWSSDVCSSDLSTAQPRLCSDPKEGSKHNRGCAVDLTLYDLRSGAAVEMPSGYDEMSKRAYADYPGGTAEQRERQIGRASCREGAKSAVLGRG